MDPFVAYHDVTSSEHQLRFNDLRSNKYRLISISIFGDPRDARYAAAWLREPGPPWQAAHGLSAAELHAFLNRWTAKGYYPVLVAATGSLANAIFAAVVERGAPGSWKARLGMTVRQFKAESLSALAANQTLLSFARYGTPRERRYAAVWSTCSSALETYPSQDPRTLRAIAAGCSSQSGRTRQPVLPAVFRIRAETGYPLHQLAP